MNGDFQIPRNCLAALLFAQVAVLLPHLFRLPAWVTLVCVVCAVWRVVLYTGRGFYPSGVLKFLLVVVAILGILSSYGNLFSLEPIVALLITAFALKLIEMKHKRDVTAVIFLAYFVAATHFLFEQKIEDAVYIIFAVLLVTAALIALQQDHGQQEQTHKNSPLPAFKMASKLLLQAVPLTILMFVVFPRIDPLWSVPGAQSSGKTGPSDSMSPGDISELANSSELAFRVSFDGDVPPQDQLYWRGLVFNHFDGRRWRPKGERGQEGKRSNGWPSSQPDVLRRGKALQYTVTIEANKQPWLYALPYARSASNSVLPGRDFTLRTVFPLDGRFQYKVESYPQSILNPSLSQQQREHALQMPDGYNPRALQFAKQLRARSADNKRYMQAVLQHFNQEAFHYTLKPGQLGRDSIDQFLFDTRRGFCEHYSSSFVFLMRAAGVPARVVVGYQGGELNPFEGYLLVHQFDAHAWSEVWFEGEGWQRVDPTAAVAPERVEHGFSEALQEELTEGNVLPFGARDLAALQWVRLRWDSVNYSWSKWILNYDAETQMQVLENWLGAVTPWRIAAFILGVGALVIGAVAISLLRQRVKYKLHVVDKHYLRYTRMLQRVAIERGMGEGPDSFAERIAAEHPDLASAARRIAYLYKRMRYEVPAGDAYQREDLRKLLHEIAQFSKALKTHTPQISGAQANIGA